MSSTRTFIILAVAVLVAGCDPHSKPVEPAAPRPDPGVEAAQHAAAAAGARIGAEAVAHAEIPRETAPRWGKLRHVRGGRRVALRESEISFPQGAIVLPDDLDFATCNEPVRPVPAAGPTSDVDDRPEIFLLMNETTLAELRFGVDAVVLAVFDVAQECRREADLTPWFLGPGVEQSGADGSGGAHPLVGAGVTYLEEEPLAPQIDVDSAPAELTVGEVRVRVTDQRATVATGASEFQIDHGFAAFDRWSISGGRIPGGWLRLTFDAEREFPKREIEAGRSATFVFREGEPIAEPVFWRARHWGVEGEETDEERVEGSWVVSVESSPVRVDATHAEGQRPMMLGVGPCPELEGLSEGHWTDDRVEWAMRSADGSWQTFARATRTTLHTAGCLAAVRSAIKPGRTHLADRAGKGASFTWRVRNAE